MKGIKECLGWMIDNQNCKIKRDYNYCTSLCWYDGCKFITEIDGRKEDIINFDAFNYEWEEVKTPYTFEEAYRMCKEEKDVCFNSEFGVFIGNMAGEIYLNSRESTGDEYENVLSCKWYKS